MTKPRIISPAAHKTGLMATIFIMLLFYTPRLPDPSDASIATTEITTDDSQKQPVLRVIGEFHGLLEHGDIKGTMGFQLQLLKDFCLSKGYKLVVTGNDTESSVYSHLYNHQVDIALLNNPAATDNLADFIKGPDILSVQTQLIYRRGNHKPQSFEDLADKRIIVNDNRLFRKQYDFLKQHYPKITFAFSNKSQEQLLQDINNGAIDYSLINSDVYLQKRSRYPRTKVAYDAFYAESVNWLISGASSNKLIKEIEHFFKTIRSNGVFDHIKEEFFGHVNASKPLSSRTFFARISQRLPQYQDLIEKISNEQGVDWRLLASMAYQESHWNPLAKSVTGVRGMMMLTRSTAKELGIKNRLDPAASLAGGARYFLSIHARLDDISEPDRTWFALAAYNVGFGHLQDARQITEFHADNPNSWSDVKKYLPLLEKKEWYQFTRYGKARGREPVKYVRYIRHFRYLLEWRFPLSLEEEDRLIRSRKSVATKIPPRPEQKAAANDSALSLHGQLLTPKRMNL